MNSGASSPPPATPERAKAVSALSAPTGDNGGGGKASPRLPRASQAQVMIKDNRCVACQKKVYEMERVNVDGLLLHKWCFRCAECGRPCKVGNYASLDGYIYCKPHFKQLFKLKGNYNQGFGTEQHKQKWID